MKITKKQIKIREISENYKDDGEGGVYAYNGKLVCRPAYQREYIYKNAQRDAVIDSVMKNRPLNVMYWSKTGDDTYEIIDGQQRTISICQYINKDFSINHRFFHNLLDSEKETLLDYELDIYICEGTDAEKLDWFRTINIAGAILTNQELLNAAYTGPWLADAKEHFSKQNCVASQKGEGYVKGNPIRQEYLEKTLKWIADRDGLKDIQDYMAIHQHDTDANELWMYYQDVVDWAKRLFPNVRKKITDVQEWGFLYNKYHSNNYNSNELRANLIDLLKDEDVTKPSGIIPYLLSERGVHDEKALAIRAFSEAQKIKKYEEQKGICPKCGKEFDYSEMEGDHIIPWSKGGKTSYDNLQMLCKRCNAIKSDR